MTGYELSRQWFDWCANHSGEYTASHSGFMFWVIELNNQLGWKERFGLPSLATMEILNIRSYKTYKSIFNDLVNWGFIMLHQKATNNHTANVIELVKITNSNTISTTNSTTKLVPTQLSSDCNLSVDIHKPITNKPITKERKEAKRIIPPTVEDVQIFFTEKGYSSQLAQTAFDYYEAANWHDGDGKQVKNWKQKMIGVWLKPKNKINTSTNGQIQIESPAKNYKGWE